MTLLMNVNLSITLSYTYILWNSKVFSWIQSESDMLWDKPR